MRTVRLGRISIHLIGSVHSSVADIAQLETIAPCHVFVEATRDTLGLIRKNPKHSPFLLDLPSVIQFADSRKIPIHAIDLPIGAITSKVFLGMSSQVKHSLWNYVLKRKLAVPVSSVFFHPCVYSRTPKFVDAFVSRWLVPSALLADAKALIKEGKPWEDVLELVSQVNDREVSSFESSSVFDPSAYIDVCKLTGIDVRLQAVLIDHRNRYMCQQIQRVVNVLDEKSVCAVIVGKNHLDGMAAELLNSSSSDNMDDKINPSTFADQVLLSQLIRN